MDRVELLTYAGIVAACLVWVTARFVRRARLIDYPVDRLVPPNLHVPNRIINGRGEQDAEGAERRSESVSVDE